MNVLMSNPTDAADLVAQLVADHLQCDSLDTEQIEEVVKLLHLCTTDGSYHALGRHCARALLAQLRGQLLARKHIASISKGQP